LAQILSKPIAKRRRANILKLLLGIFLFLVVLLIPPPASMEKVAVRYTIADDLIRQEAAQSLLAKPYEETTRAEACLLEVFLFTVKEGRSEPDTVFEQSSATWKRASSTYSDSEIHSARELASNASRDNLELLLEWSQKILSGGVTADELTDSQQSSIAKGVRHIRLGTALIVFVIFCFLTEAIPFPAVAFLIGLIAVFGGLVAPSQVASLFWSDATWFIMGSLMLAAALVKTGLDKRISLTFFGMLRRPTVLTVTGMLILVISPLAAVLSDHVLAAIFLPIGLIFYNNSLSRSNPEDPELAKMLMITIAMACNIGGFGTPSGGARNVIVMNYLEDIYGITIGYGEWIIYAMPFVLVMMLLTWVLINLSFKPRIRDLGPAMKTLRHDIAHMGPWNRTQVFTLLIFIAVIIGWITEKTLLNKLLGFSPGIGVIAVTGAMIYLASGVVNWREYQHEVDWGVIWLYAGAIVFGRILDQTGTAAWLAGSFLQGLAELGLTSGLALVLSGSMVTTFLTNLLAAGPTAAAVAPITLEMAAASAPASHLIPMMGLATALASSFAYLIVIGTPPNTIVYSSGHLRSKDFLRVGISATLLAFVVLIGLSLYYWPSVLQAP